MKKKEFDTRTELFSLVDEHKDAEVVSTEEISKRIFELSKKEESIFDIELRDVEDDKEFKKAEREVELESIETDDGFMDLLKEL